MIHYITTNGIGNAWVAVELEILQKYGIKCILHSMRSPHQYFFGSGWASDKNENTRLLYPVDTGSIILSAVSAPFIFRGRFFTATMNAIFSRRESVRARVACIVHLLVAIDWARKLRREDVHLIHSQWIQSGGTIGWYAAWLLDRPFSFTGHAVDLFRDRSALRDKIASASFIIAISQFHKDFYISEGAAPEKIHIVYCGIDLKAFAYRYRPVKAQPTIMSFGRLVEKKGYDTLVDACAIIKGRGRKFRCIIAGDGPEENFLRRRITDNQLEAFVEITGTPIMQEDIPSWLDEGHIYAQPCKWSKDNDVDGIPRSLMEAMACGLPSISTRVAGIPDLVIDDKSGLLIEPENPEELARAIERLIDYPELALSLSRGGRKHVEDRFNLDTCLAPLANLFRKFTD